MEVADVLSNMVGSWPQKQVGDGRLAPKTGGRWEIAKPPPPQQV